MTHGRAARFSLNELGRRKGRERIPIEYFGGCVLTKARLELPVTPADNAARVNRDLCSPEHKHKSIHRVECFKKYSKTDLYQLSSKLKHTNPSAAAKRVCLSESLDSFSMPCILLAGVLTSKSFIALCQWSLSVWQRTCQHKEVTSPKTNPSFQRKVHLLSRYF